MERWVYSAGFLLTPEHIDIITKARSWKLDDLEPRRTFCELAQADAFDRDLGIHFFPVKWNCIFVATRRYPEVKLNDWVHNRPMTGHDLDLIQAFAKKTDVAVDPPNFYHSWCPKVDSDDDECISLVFPVPKTYPRATPNILIESEEDLDC